MSETLPPLRIIQLVACTAVALCALQAKRVSFDPVTQLETHPFALRETAAKPVVDPMEQAAIATPGSQLIDVPVQRDDTLEHIFRRLRLSLSDLADVRALDGVQALLDRLNPGEHLKVLRLDDSLIGLERHVSLTQKLEVRRSDDGFHASMVAKAIAVETATARGSIDSSLFESANSAGLSDPSVLRMAKIFASDIDFVIGLRSGDRFVVDYQRVMQDGHYVKDGDILAARFINQGHVYEAVRFVGPDGVSRYYSPDGRTMEKAFLRAPLEFKRISSGFSAARFHPILNMIRAHRGIDYAAPSGTPVYAAGAGRVKFRGTQGGYGNVMQIDHGDGIVTVYGHLSRFANAKLGAHVERGETIAFVGMTGLATGPHLHFEYRIRGEYVDPQKVKLPEAVPINASLRPQFDSQTQPLLAALSP
jgi:murein DD-endopeptidase MepM/ murein hydrolase activator NlpD